MHMGEANSHGFKPREQYRGAAGSFDIGARNIQTSSACTEIIDNEHLAIAKLNRRLTWLVPILSRIAIETQSVQMVQESPIGRSDWLTLAEATCLTIKSGR